MHLISLRNQAEFDLVNKLGVKAYDSDFIMILARCNLKSFFESSGQYFALGMKVSRKLSKKAVIRNKVKRRIRHIVRTAVKACDVNGNHGLIVIPKRSFENANFALLYKNFYNNLSKLLRKIGEKNLYLPKTPGADIKSLE